MGRSIGMQHCLLVLAAAMLISASATSATRSRLLLSSGSPPNSGVIDSILSKGVAVFSFGEKTQIPPPILIGAADLASFSTPAQPSSGYLSQSSTILFACRAVGNQIYTTSRMHALPMHALPMLRLVLHSSRNVSVHIERVVARVTNFSLLTCRCQHVLRLRQQRCPCRPLVWPRLCQDCHQAFLLQCHSYGRGKHSV